MKERVWSKIFWNTLCLFLQCCHFFNVIKNEKMRSNDWTLIYYFLCEFACLAYHSIVILFTCVFNSNVAPWKSIIFSTWKPRLWLWENANRVKYRHKNIDWLHADEIGKKLFFLFCWFVVFSFGISSDHHSSSFYG